MTSELKSQPSTIAEEINRLQKLQSSLQESQASLFNLIVYTQEKDRTDYFKHMMLMVIDQFPCRILFIEGHPLSSNNCLKVKTLCKNNTDKACISYNTLVIQAEGKELETVPFLILPLLIPDLPIYLLWGQDPSEENIILPHLKKLANRLILDPQYPQNLKQFSLSLLNEVSHSSTPVVDMTWARVSGWREVLAQTYDSPERFEQLATASRVTITYNAPNNNKHPRSATLAVYLQAWIASRLKWTWQKLEHKPGETILYYTSAKGSHTISLKKDENNDYTADQLLCLEVCGSQDYLCNFKRRLKHQIEVHASNQYQCELPFNLLMPTLESPKSFMQEVFYQKMSDQYIPMLKMLSQINWS